MLRLGCRVVAVLVLALTAISQPASAWTLRAEDGRRVAAGDFAPRWLLLYLGYTHCADLCPAALSDLGDVLARLGSEAARLQPAFVSIDPERDTPGVLRRYLENFATPILPLTGSDAELRELAAALHYHFVRYTDPALADDTFDHTSSFFLLDPEGRLAADFATELAPAEIATAIREHLETKGAPP